LPVDILPGDYEFRLRSGDYSHAWQGADHWLASKPVTVIAGGSLSGTWTMHYDWGCKGSPATATWKIYTNNTFTDSLGGLGTWKQQGNGLDITYINNYYYYGYLDNWSGSSMSGTIWASGYNLGCWSATRTSTIASMTEEEPNSDQPGPLLGPSGNKL
jgi:hypothetical protein